MGDISSITVGPKAAEGPKRLRISGDAHFVRLEEQIVVADMRSGHYLGLDGVGARVWDLIDQGATRDDMINRLSAEYDVAIDVLVKDVEQLIQDLIRRRLVELEVQE